MLEVEKRAVESDVIQGSQAGLVVVAAAATASQSVIFLQSGRLQWSERRSR